MYEIVSVEYLLRINVAISGTFCTSILWVELYMFDG